jgi:glycosyltransferase involved in cell wall biosynthesis
MITDHSDSTDRVDGGVQAVTKYLVDALIRFDDVEIHVLSFKYGIQDSWSSAANGYRRHVLAGARFGTLTGYWKDQQALNSYLDKINPTVVHAQGAGHNGILASRSRFPSVITIHGIMAEEAKFFSGRARRARHWLMSKVSEHYCISKAEHTILISPYVAEYFKNRLTGKQYLIPNPIADGFFTLTRRETAGRVLFAGRLVALKGVMDLIRATSKVAQSQKIDLILAGSLDDHRYVSQLKSAARRLGINDLVQFRGLLNEQELREELGRCAVLVLPSYQESAPMVIIEAMAAGIPVIASNVGGLPYQVKEGETGFLIKPGDVNALSERLIALLADRSMRDAFGKAAKNLATEEYRADRVARRTIDVYQQIVQGDSPDFS